ncbi:Mushroom body large-type Kenyon cell-specific protein 1 [Eumeta japonica]|uniref:Mushroom body large-type Kenyon cell-specific protein 1 n=1 Tax=Eumeta variegata TaxID=151549 RepID=A0A4C1TSJ5_EUMVA|nr:Mushroom body large-type Kenyon cell-specific protein 1 [Eumeta japonica]
MLGQTVPTRPPAARPVPCHSFASGRLPHAVVQTRDGLARHRLAPSGRRRPPRASFGCRNRPGGCARAMAECSFARCQQERRAIRKELQRWTKNMVYILGFAAVRTQIVQLRPVSAVRFHSNCSTLIAHFASYLLGYWCLFRIPVSIALDKRCRGRSRRANFDIP